MALASATKAVSPITSALRASARRNPLSAVTAPCSPRAATSRPKTTANPATTAKASRFSRSHQARQRVARQSSPADSGTSNRRIKTIPRFFRRSSRRHFASNNSRRTLHHETKRSGQPHAEYQQRAEHQSHRRDTIPGCGIAGPFGFRRSQQNARQLIEDAAKRAQQRQQHNRAHN